MLVVEVVALAIQALLVDWGALAVVVTVQF